MALFVLTCVDRPGALEHRLALRPDHLAYLEAHKQMVRLAGPQLDAAGQPVGSLLLIEAEDLAAAEAFAAGDPYARGDLFETVAIRGFRLAVGALA